MSSIEQNYPEWDTVSHMRAVRANPDRFFNFRALLYFRCVVLPQIAAANSLEKLNAVVQPLAKAAKKAGDTDLLEELKAVAAKRKAALSK